MIVSTLLEFQRITSERLAEYSDNNTFSVSFSFQRDGNIESNVIRSFHIIQYSKQRPHKVKCLSCNKILGPINFGALTSHIRRCSRGDDFICHICDRKFSRNCHLKRHLFSVHNIGDQQLFQCPINECKKIFTQRHLLNRHLRTVHQQQQQQQHEEKIVTKEDNEIHNNSSQSYPLIPQDANLIQSHLQTCAHTTIGLNDEEDGNKCGNNSEGGNCTLKKIVKHDDHFGFLFSCGEMICSDAYGTTNSQRNAHQLHTSCSTNHDSTASCTSSEKSFSSQFCSCDIDDVKSIVEENSKETLEKKIISSSSHSEGAVIKHGDHFDVVINGRLVYYPDQQQLNLAQAASDGVTAFNRVSSNCAIHGGQDHGSIDFLDDSLTDFWDFLSSV